MSKTNYFIKNFRLFCIFKSRVMFKKLFGKRKKSIFPTMVSEDFLQDEGKLVFSQGLDFWGDDIIVFINTNNWAMHEAVRSSNQIIDWLNVNQYKLEAHIQKLQLSYGTINEVHIEKEKFRVNTSTAASITIDSQFSIID